MDKGQHEQRPRKGSSSEHQSNRKATEAVPGPREVGRGQVSWGPVGRGKFWILFYGLRDVTEEF